MGTTGGLDTDVDNLFLFCADTLHVDLTLEGFAARQFDVHQQHPIASHREVNAGLVASARYLV